MAQKRSPVERALAALDKRLSGVDLTQGEADALGALESSLGLKRAGGLAAYAPRTRRRYTAAARRGETATQANRREYTRRPSLTERIQRLAEHGAALGYGRGDYTKDSIDALTATFGKKETERLLREQKAATEAYQRGDSEPGQRMWASLQEEYDDMDEEAEFLKQLKQPYAGRYHGRR